MSSDRLTLTPAQRLKLLAAVAGSVGGCRQQFLRSKDPHRDTAGNYALGLLTLVEALGIIPICPPAEVLDEDADAWVAAHRALWEAVSDIHGDRGRLADFAAIRQFVPFSWNGDSYPSACHAAFAAAEKVLRDAWGSIPGRRRPFPVASLDSPFAGSSDSPGEFDPALWRRVPLLHGLLPIPLLDTGPIRAAIRQELAALQTGAASPPEAPPRLRFDDAALTVTLDGQPYPSIDPVPYRLLRALHEAGPDRIVRGTALLGLHGLKGKKLSREWNKLPAELREIVRGSGGKGYWLELPPQTSR
jgi:hypothetical protein